MDKHDFAITILVMEKSEWDRIKYNSDKSIQLNGANEVDCKVYEMAHEKSEELLLSISELQNLQREPYDHQ
jgi:hypothetical protein